MIDRHLHWQFFAFDEEIPNGMCWPVVIDVIGLSTEEDARIAAMDIVIRNRYKLKSVWECNRCGFENRMSSSMEKLTK